jgi:hypothetical protein
MPGKQQHLFVVTHWLLRAAMVMCLGAMGIFVLALGAILVAAENLDGNHLGIPPNMEGIARIDALWIGGLALTGVLACVVLVLFALRATTAIVKTAIAGDPFLNENARRLNLVGWLLLAFVACQFLTHFIVHRIVESLAAEHRLPFDTIGRFSFGSSVSLVGLFAVLLIFVLAQIFRRNYPSYSAGLSLNIPLRNRAAQADYVTQALSLRQSELGLQKAVNQIRVDVQNAVIGLRQARVRYDSAVKARILQRQTLDADQKKYTLGASTVFQVVTDQQALAAAQSAEQQALANYSHARVAFDQNMGRTLETNHISIDEALAGQVSRESALPANLPAPESGLPQPRQQ